MATFTLMTTDAGLKAPRLTGTLTTNGTTAVVGVGTEFVADLVGYTFRFVGGTVDYTIASVTDATHLTTTTAVPAGSGQIAFLSSEQGLLEANFHLLGTAAVADTTDFQPANASTTLLGNTTTGTGSIVLATNPTFTTPALGAATATSLTTSTIKPASDTTSAIVVTNAAASANVIVVDTTNNYVGINRTPGYPFDVNGLARIVANGQSTTVIVRNTSANGWSAVDCFSSGGSQVGGMGYGNPSASSNAGNFYVYSATNVPLVLGAGTAGPQINYGTAVPALTTNGQIAVAYTSNANRLYWYSNAGVRYVGADAGFEIPSDVDDPLTGGKRNETLDYLSGEQMGVDDLVVGIVDRSLPNDDPSKPNCLHGVWTKHTSAHAKMGGASGALTCDGKPILCDGKPVQVVNGLIVLASE